MTDHDKLFKELLSTFFAEFIEGFLPEVAGYVDLNSKVFLDKEVFSNIPAGERHEVDLVARIKFREQDAFFLIHIEHQAQRHEEFGRRMFNYFALLHGKYKLPVYPVVLFSHGSATPEPDTYSVAFPDFDVLDFRFRAIQLSLLSWRDFLKRRNPVFCALMSRMNVKKEERAKVKLECLRMLLTLKVDEAKQHFLTRFIDSYLRLNKDETLRFDQQVSKLPVANERTQIMELTTSWEEKGMQKALHENLIDVLEVRFGEVPFELREQLGRIEDLDYLKRLHRLAVTVKSIQDFQANVASPKKRK